MGGAIVRQAVTHANVFYLQVEFDVVGSAYANALVELSQANNDLESVHADVDGLQSLLKDSDEIKVAF
jgi:F0F1-type ATP synthase delta subunit